MAKGKGTNRGFMGGGKDGGFVTTPMNSTSKKGLVTKKGYKR
jgi:hypothetical protein